MIEAKTTCGKKITNVRIFEAGFSGVLEGMTSLGVWDCDGEGTGIVEGTTLCRYSFVDPDEGPATGTEGRVCKDIAKRQVFGSGKYRISIEDNPHTLREWLNHAYLESLDRTIYLKRAIEKIDAEDEIKRLENKV